MIRNIIFDVGKVLQYIEGDKMFDKVAQKYKTQPDKIRAAYTKWIDDCDRGILNTEEFAQKLSQETSVQIDAEEFWSIFFQNARINRPLIKLIKETLCKRFSIYILSNNSERNIPVFREQADLGDAVVEEFYSKDFGVIKPEKRFYELFLEKTGINPGESVFIDDREEFLEGAKSFGIKTILFKDNEQLQKDLRKLAHF